MYKYLGKNINSDFYQGINHKVFLQAILAEITRIVESSNIVISHFVKSSGSFQLVGSNRTWFDLFKIFENYPEYYDIGKKNILLLKKIEREAINKSHFEYLFKNYRNSELIKYDILYIEDENDDTITEIFFEYNINNSIDAIISEIANIKVNECLFTHYTSLLGNSLYEEISLRLDLFPFATNRNLDDEISNLIQSLDEQKKDNTEERVIHFSDHRLMLFLPEFKALFYKISNSFKDQINSKIEQWIEGENLDEKNRLLTELRKLLKVQSFKFYFNHINKEKVEFDTLSNKIDEKILDEELIISCIESIPQAIGDGIVGESANTKIGFIIPTPLISDYRRSSQKKGNNSQGDSNSNYFEYYESLKVIEDIFLESPDNKSALVYPLLDKGELFGCLFLLTKHSNILELYEKFISSSKFIQDFTLNVKTILNTQFYENAAKSILEGSKHHNEQYPILNFSLNNLHMICNIQLGFFIKIEDLRDSSIQGSNIIYFEKIEGLWLKYLKDDGIAFKSNCELKRFLKKKEGNKLVNIEKLKEGFPIYYQGSLNNFFKLNGTITYWYTDDKKLTNQEIYIGSVVFLPIIDSLNDRELILILFFSEEIEVIKNNMLTIWQNLSSIFALNQFNIINKFMEFPKRCKLLLENLVIKKEKDEPIELSESWDDLLTNELIEESPHFRNYHKTIIDKLDDEDQMLNFVVETIYSIDSQLPNHLKDLLFIITTYVRINTDQSFNISFENLDYDKYPNYFKALELVLKNRDKKEVKSIMDKLNNELGSYSFLLRLKNYKRILILITYLIKQYQYEDKIL